MPEPDHASAINIESPFANLFVFATVIVVPVDSLVILVATFLTLSPESCCFCVPVKYITSPSTEPVTAESKVIWFLTKSIVDICFTFL